MKAKSVKSVTRPSQIICRWIRALSGSCVTGAKSGITLVVWDLRSQRTYHKVTSTVAKTARLPTMNNCDYLN